MRSFSILVCLAALIGAASSAESQTIPAKPDDGKAASSPAAPTLLPSAFAGWVETASPKTVTEAAQADPTNAEALKDYDFTDAVFEDYKRGGETLDLRALRFRDASGAFGAYSFYRQNGWPKADIGSGATANHDRVLFWLSDVLIDAKFSHIGPMSASELRELASHLAVPSGNRTLTPPVLNNLPQDSMEKQTTHYALGAASYAGSGGVMPPDVVGFDRGAETVTANYTLRSGPATLTIIDYPTPQMAAAQETKIRDYLKAGNAAQPAWPKALQDSDQASLEVRRSGPLVAVVSGDAVPDESHKLISMVHYDADITSIPGAQGDSDVSKTAKLLMGIAGIVIIGGSAALLLGFFLGGGRALYRMARGRPISSVYEEEFIRIDLREPWTEPAGPVDRAHPKG